jgi:hypothetical protein
LHVMSLLLVEIVRFLKNAPKSSKLEKLELGLI